MVSMVLMESSCLNPFLRRRAVPPRPYRCQHDVVYREWQQANPLKLLKRLRKSVLLGPEVSHGATRLPQTPNMIEVGCSTANALLNRHHQGLPRRSCEPV